MSHLNIVYEHHAKMPITIYCTAKHAVSHHYHNDPNMIICKYTNRKTFEKSNDPLDKHSLSIWGVYKYGEYGICIGEKRQSLHPQDIAKLKYSIIYIPHSLYRHIDVKRAFPYASHIYICED